MNSQFDRAFQSNQTNATDSATDSTSASSSAFASSSSAPSLSEETSIFHCDIYLIESIKQFNSNQPIDHVAINKFLHEFTQFLSNLSHEYNWYNSHYSISLINHSTSSKSKSNSKSILPYISISLNFSFNYTDELYILWLLIESSKQPQFHSKFISKLYDSDGEFLLIEISDEKIENEIESELKSKLKSNNEIIPRWAAGELEQVQNRIFLYNGEIHFISPELQMKLMNYNNVGNEQEISAPPLLFSLTAVFSHPQLSRAQPAVQLAIQNRLKNFPHSAIESSRFHCRALVSCPVADLLSRDPTLIRRFVIAFDSRDLLDQRKSERMENFLVKLHGEDNSNNSTANNSNSTTAAATAAKKSTTIFPLSFVRVLFTRRHYSILHHSGAFKFPHRLQSKINEKIQKRENSTTTTEYNNSITIGMKLMAGCEIYYNSLKRKLENRQKRKKNEENNNTNQQQSQKKNYEETTNSIRNNRLKRLNEWMNSPAFEQCDDGDYFSELTSIEHGEWLLFLEKLEKFGFFHDSVKNSTARNGKIQLARKQFLQQICERLNRPSEKSDEFKTEKIDEERKNEELNAEMSDRADFELMEEILAKYDLNDGGNNSDALLLTEFDSFPADDPTDWLEFTPEDIDSAIRMREKQREILTGANIFDAENSPAQGAEENQTADGEVSRLVNSVKKFVDKVSSFEGAELPEDDDEDEDEDAESDDAESDAEADAELGEEFADSKKSAATDFVDPTAAPADPSLFSDFSRFAAADPGLAELIKYLNAPELKFDSNKSDSQDFSSDLKSAFPSFNSALKKLMKENNGKSDKDNEIELPDTDSEAGESDEELSSESEESDGEQETRSRAAVENRSFEVKEEKKVDSKPKMEMEISPEPLEEEESIRSLMAEMEREISGFAGSGRPNDDEQSIAMELLAAHEEQFKSAGGLGPLTGLINGLGLGKQIDYLRRENKK